MYRFYGNKLFFILLLALAVYAQEQKRIAILNTEDDGEPPMESTDLNHLTVKLREIAGNVLQDRYGIMSSQSIIDKLGKDDARKACKEAKGCLAQLGKKISADYIGQARVGRFGKNLTINVELYNSGNGLQTSVISGDAENISGLLAILNEKAPGMFGKMPGTLSKKDGIRNIKTVEGYKPGPETNYLASITSEPEGAVLNINGVNANDCTKTPCKVVLAEGNIRIIATLDQYEKSDTTILLKQNNQSIKIKLNPNFGILEIKPAYIDGIGKNEQWNLVINGKPFSSLENRLPPDEYEVKLSHRCYEEISFEVGINKGGKRTVFDIAGYKTLKKGGLFLNAKKNGELTSAPVFVNDNQIGETPFNGPVPVCAKIEVGSGREKVEVKLKHNDKVSHTANISDNIFTDPRDGKKYKIAKIGTQIWMAENLNYNANGSKCYDNQESNCQKYGRLYNLSTAKTVCPKSWHLPTKAEWDVLISVAGKNLKSSSGWGNSSKQPGNGDDIYSFSALPGGWADSSGTFSSFGFSGIWWSTSSNYIYSETVFRLIIRYDSDTARWDESKGSKSNFYSVRCLRD